MRRRRYLTRIGAGLSVGITGLAGCGAPGEETATETEAGGGEETPTPEETEATTVTEGGQAGNQTGNETGNQTGNETTAGGGGGQGAPNTIEMVTDGSEYYFNPIGLFVEPGETITWVNQSGSHSSTAYTQDNPQSEVNRIPGDAEGWNSDIISEQGAEFTHTFEVQGTYDYYCIPHKSLGMVGRVVVGEPGDVEGDPPDGPVPAEQRIVEEGAVAIEDFNP